MPRMALLGAGGSSAFVGPYDAIPSIAAAYGVRRLLSSWTGNLLRLRRSSDSTESDFGYVAETGALDTAAIATFIGGGSGFVTTWYDQSGNGKNAVQATTTKQPLYVASAQNSKPVARGDGIDDFLLITRNAAAAMSVLTVTQKRTAPAGNQCVWSMTPSSQVYTNSGTSSGFNYYQPVALLGGAPTSCNVLSMIFSSVSSLTNYVNAAGSVNFDPVDGYSTATVMALFSESVGTSNFGNFDIGEMVIASAAWGTSDRQAAEAAANAYWAAY